MIMIVIMITFETTMTNVLSASNPTKALATSTGSTLAKKRKVLPVAPAAPYHIANH